MKSITVLAPAKLNLTLDITGVEPNGYHTLDMMMQTVNLYERVTLHKSETLRLKLPGSTVPANDNNTAVKAALAFFDYTGLLAGVDIVVRKSVPVRAGMAGGSADAAAVLVGLNELYGARLSQDELCSLGLKIGADVPFSILGGTARVRGIGDQITPMPNCPRCWFTVCMPQGGISTPQAYARYDVLGTDVRPNNDLAQKALFDGDLDALCAQMSNALEFSSQSPENKPIEAILRDCGALAALMTGSGAAVFGVFRDEKKAQAARAELKKHYPQSWVLHPVPRGAHSLGIK
ncbi:4-(cytidine 5'-diphospho)-2-C-methyl-D-erythritol kinase [uncultured Ruthenibacterium sp.]|uniref:4-(cytidine 5'-diphospho)-2-C-methyl-D-erythritol kinase n=1 Tax=uncultured Ruthenibacterium sp. TaxID=1905347 RepID=UPI00349E78C9